MDRRNRYLLVTLVKLFAKGNVWAYQLAMLILGVGSVAFCLSLYRSRLLPPAVEPEPLAVPVHRSLETGVVDLEAR